MISFRISEIPRGLSEEKLSVEAEELGIEQSDIKKVRLHLRFHKQDENLRIECHIEANATFVCDRSLDLFDEKLQSDYEVVFQQKIENEREDLSGTLRELDPAQNVIDITREIRDTVLLSIPVKKLHPRYYIDGEVTNFEARYGEEKEGYDPRWDALSKLKQEIQKN